MTITEKPCTGCKETKPVSEFGIRKSSKDGYQWKCKTCRLAEKNANRQAKRDAGLPYDSLIYQRKHYDRIKERRELIKTNPSTPKKKQEARGVSRRFLDGMKTMIPCTDCGINYPPMSMDWDHLEAEQKKVNVSQGLHLGFLGILEEIDKCELVCTNCHRIRTAQRRGSIWDAERLAKWGY